MFIDKSEIEFVSKCLTDFKNHQNILLLSDVTNSSILLSSEFTDSNLEIAKFSIPQVQQWNFVNDQLFVKSSNSSSYYPYIISKPLNEYDLIIFIGECNNLEFMINSPKLIVIDPQSKSYESYDGAKEFRKRISLIEKFKNQTRKLIGIVFVNYNESVSSIMNETKDLCKFNKKNPYFISLNQSDYELRLGNFGQLEGFVIVNSCACNRHVAVNTSKYFYPVIFWKEFLISCGKRIVYGGIEWNQECDQDADNEIEEMEDLNLNEQNMKLVEKDLFKKPDGWFGLIVDAGANDIGEIKEGQRGIPSSYVNEHELF